MRRRDGGASVSCGKEIRPVEIVDKVIWSGSQELRSGAEQAIEWFELAEANLRSSGSEATSSGR
jgi:hypothetical protein